MKRTKKNINGNTKLKLNLSLLKQKLLEEKALQHKNVLEATKNPGFAVEEHTSDGPNANNDKEHPTIGNLVGITPEENVNTTNEAVHGPIAKANQQVRNSGNNPRSLHTISQPNVPYTFFIVV